MKFPGKILARFFVVVSLLAATSAHKDPGAHEFWCSADVVHLDKQTFQEKTSDGNVWFIKFFAPWCGHCKSLVPVWKGLGEEFRSNKQVKIAHVDCTIDKEVCTKAQVRTFPTLIVYYGGDAFRHFTGPRTHNDLIKFLEESLADLTAETTS
ncbi:hypothetical protein BSKO_00189 [Bryopsis sp. KO-2023]|nr:hypothetical protein BSKO_00189 [Bryopsis sp. KO-2023]